MDFVSPFQSPYPKQGNLLSLGGPTACIAQLSKEILQKIGMLAASTLKHYREQLSSRYSIYSLQLLTNGR